MKVIAELKSLSLEFQRVFWLDFAQTNEITKNVLVLGCSDQPCLLKT